VFFFLWSVADHGRLHYFGAVSCTLCPQHNVNWFLRIFGTENCVTRDSVLCTWPDKFLSGRPTGCRPLSVRLSVTKVDRQVRVWHLKYMVVLDPYSLLICDQSDGSVNDCSLWPGHEVHMSWNSLSLSIYWHSLDGTTIRYWPRTPILIRLAVLLMCCFFLHLHLCAASAHYYNIVLLPRALGGRLW